MVLSFPKNLEEDQNCFKNEDLNQGELDQLDTSSYLKDLEYGKVDQFEDQSSPKKKKGEQKELDQIDVVSSLEEIMTEVA